MIVGSCVGYILSKDLPQIQSWIGYVNFVARGTIKYRYFKAQVGNTNISTQDSLPLTALCGHK